MSENGTNVTRETHENVNNKGLYGQNVYSFSQHNLKVLTIRLGLFCCAFILV